MIVIGDSGHSRKSVTFNRNRRSRSSGTTGHVRAESVVKFVRNTHSPIYNIERLAVPVLLMHRRDDERIPFAQGRRMYQALQRAGKSVEWLEVPKSEAPDAVDRARLQIYQKLVAFLDKHLGG